MYFPLVFCIARAHVFRDSSPDWRSHRILRLLNCALSVLLTYYVYFWRSSLKTWLLTAQLLMVLLTSWLPCAHELDILALQGNIPPLLRKIVQAPVALVWTSHLWRAWVTWAGGQFLKSSVIWNEHKQRGMEEKRECHCVQISCGRFGCCWCSVFLCINFSSKLPYLSLDDDLPLNRLYFFLIISPFGTSQSLPFSLSLAHV